MLFEGVLRGLLSLDLDCSLNVGAERTICLSQGVQYHRSLCRPLRFIWFARYLVLPTSARGIVTDGAVGRLVEFDRGCVNGL